MRCEISGKGQLSNRDGEGREPYKVRGGMGGGGTWSPGGDWRCAGDIQV